MKKSRETKILWGMVFAIVVAGCAGQSPHQKDSPLPPPEIARPQAADAVREGNRFFAEHQWTAAIRKYQDAIHAQSTLAEAHYNLGLSLDQQGRFSESQPHYMKAADLAPGHPVIWNAPPFRKYGTVEPTSPAPSTDGHMGHQH